MQRKAHPRDMQAVRYLSLGFNRRQLGLTNLESIGMDEREEKRERTARLPCGAPSHFYLTWSGLWDAA